MKNVITEQGFCEGVGLGAMPFSESDDIEHDTSKKEKTSNDEE